jgi:hypothetical protein
MDFFIIENEKVRFIGWMLFFWDSVPKNFNLLVGLIVA